MPAVIPQGFPRRVLGDALVDPVRLDQAQERFTREGELVDGGSQGTHHGPGRLALVAGFELALELVQCREPVALQLVAENVHEPGEPVDGA